MSADALKLKADHDARLDALMREVDARLASFRTTEARR